MKEPKIKFRFDLTLQVYDPETNVYYFNMMFYTPFGFKRSVWIRT